jgi:ubiquinone/menaquinone biosynthesis C-methylase UbiE
MNNWTGERLETFIHTRDTIEHLHRYAIVSNYIKDKIVLDIASGEGYGSNLMSEKASVVYGVDIDEATVLAAKAKYKKENLKFLTGSASKIPLEDNSIEVAVSFETIEHHDKHEEMMLEIKRVLKPNGIFILSTPDKFYYSDKRNFENKFHVKELYKDEFERLVSNYFKKVQLLNQRYINGNSIIQKCETNQAEFYSGSFSKLELVEVDPMYLISIASDSDFHEQNSSLFEGSQVNEENYYKENIIPIYNSNSYKLGHFLLTPLKILKRILK